MTKVQNSQGEKATLEASVFLRRAFWALALGSYLGVGSCGVAELPLVAAGQRQEIPRFTSGVDVVQFTVTVLDKNRRPIEGLTAADFEVMVDGKPTPLAAFAAVTLPGESPGSATSIPLVAPDVQSNQLSAEGRLVVIVMDRSIRDGDMKTAHAIANAAIVRLGPNDLGAVVYTGQVSRGFSQGLTADRQRLHAAANLTTLGAVHELPTMPSLSAAIASHAAPQVIGESAGVPALASEERSGECVCGMCVIKGLTDLARALAGATGREKSILFIGSDIAIASTVQEAGNYCSAYIYPGRDNLTRALDAANVTFHAIDPHGLDPLEGISFRTESLAVLPDYTGGRTVINNNRPEEKIDAIFNESRSYYVIAVARARAASKDETPHKIKIGVKRGEAIVNARNLYFAADPKAEAKRAPNAAAGALNELMPGGDFPLQMNLVPQFARDGSSEIRVLLGVDSSVAGKLDVLIRAYDRVFTPVGEPLKQRLDVPASAVTGSAMFQWTSVLKPAPGAYEVRAAVATADGKRAANVIGYVDVPDLKRDGIGLSGIIVTSGRATTLRRVFAPGEAIGLACEVARLKAGGAAVEVRYRISDALGQELGSGEMTPGLGADTARTHVAAVRVPEARGQYVITVEANDGRKVVQRQMLLAVR